jgi:hypothetical protein
MLQVPHDPHDDDTPEPALLLEDASAELANPEEDGPVLDAVSAELANPEDDGPALDAVSAELAADEDDEGPLEEMPAPEVGCSPLEAREVLVPDACTDDAKLDAPPELGGPLVTPVTADDEPLDGTHPASVTGRGRSTQRPWSQDSVPRQSSSALQGNTQRSPSRTLPSGQMKQPPAGQPRAIKPTAPSPYHREDVSGCVMQDGVCLPATDRARGGSAGRAARPS